MGLAIKGSLMAKKKSAKKVAAKTGKSDGPEKDNSKDPCGRAVHADPNAPPSVEQKPLPSDMAQKPLEQKSPAEWAYERLILYIQNFEEQLDEEHEVAVGFADGSVGALRIEGVGFFDPDIVTFYGADEFGGRTQLIQHVTQLSVTLRAMPKKVPEDEPRRIGFRLAEDLKGD
jgi:hypothetical protein